MDAGRRRPALGDVNRRHASQELYLGAARKAKDREIRSYGSWSLDFYSTRSAGLIRRYQRGANTQHSISNQLIEIILVGITFAYHLNSAAIVPPCGSVKSSIRRATMLTTGSAFEEALALGALGAWELGKALEFDVHGPVEDAARSTARFHRPRHNSTPQSSAHQN